MNIRQWFGVRPKMPLELLSMGLALRFIAAIHDMLCVYVGFAIVLNPSVEAPSINHSVFGQRNVILMWASSLMFGGVFAAIGSLSRITYIEVVGVGLCAAGVFTWGLAIMNNPATGNATGVIFLAGGVMLLWRAICVYVSHLWSLLQAGGTE